MKEFLFGTCLFCTASIVASASAKPSAIEEALSEYGIKADLSAEYKVVKNQQVKGVLKNLHIIEISNSKNERIEIRRVSPIESSPAQSLIDSESSALKRLFAAEQTPYLGDIAEALGGCPAGYGPIERPVSFLKRHDIKILLGAADAKRSLGACNSDTAKFKGAYLAYYDEDSKALWTWKFFVPWTGTASLKSNWVEALLRGFHK